jgi:hypothetical protein
LRAIEETMKPIPNDSEALIRELAEAYPARCIGPQDTLEAAHRYAGAVEVVEALVKRLEFTRANSIIGDQPHVRRRKP